jgi:hypothetical protein
VPPNKLNKKRKETGPGKNAIPATEPNVPVGTRPVLIYLPAKMDWHSAGLDEHRDA